MGVSASALKKAGAVVRGSARSYNTLVEWGVLKERPGLTKFCDKLGSALSIVQLLQECITDLKDTLGDPSGKLQSLLMSIEHLDFILKQAETNLHNKTREAKRISEIYSSIREAFLKLHEEYDAGKARAIHESQRIHLKVKRWLKTAQMNKDLIYIQNRIKCATDMSLQLLALSNSVALTKANILQQYNANGTWLVTDLENKPPGTLWLQVEEKVKEFKIAWSGKRNSEIFFYELCYDEDQNMSISLDGSTKETMIGPPRVAPGKLYSMKIRGISSAGAGEWSDVVVARFTRMPPSKPDPPEVSMISTTKAAVTVVSPKKSHKTEPPIIAWNVQYVIESDKHWRSKHFNVKSNKATNSLTVNDLIPNQEYHFRVQAKNSVGGSDFSQPVCITAAYVTKPLLGRNTSVYVSDFLDIDVVNASEARVTITAPESKSKSPITTWKIDYKCSSSKEWASIVNEAEPGVKSHSLCIEELAPNQGYNIRVQGINARGAREFTRSACFKTRAQEYYLAKNDTAATLMTIFATLLTVIIVIISYDLFYMYA